MVDGWYWYDAGYACGGIRFKNGRIVETADIFWKMKSWGVNQIQMAVKNNKIKKLGIKVLVCGGRDYTETVYLFKKLDALNKIYNFNCLVNGYAKGADKKADRWSRMRRVPRKRYPAKWKEFGKKAGPIRNAVMLEENPDIELVIAFPGGNGTQDMISKAREAEITIIDLRWEK